MFKRKIYEKLLEWKDSSQGKSAVLIEGARRIGKSTVAEYFAKEQYDDYILLDFSIEGANVRNNFEENIGDLDTFFRNLFTIKGKELKKRKSVIIFDEVQLFPLARQAIKHLVKDGRYDYIETGSLISIKENVKDILIPSEELKLKMFPMDFEEFMWAEGNTVLIPTIKESFDKRKALGDIIHREAMKHFRTYMAVGGMPQAVEAFVNGESYQRIDSIKKDILALYYDDLKKYDDRYSEKASLIFRTIPIQLTEHNSNFRFSEIDKNARYKNYVDSVEFVSESMMANECVNVTSPDVLMELYAEKNNFKLYMGDTGLLITALLAGNPDSKDIYQALIYDKLSSNLGMVVENVVAQMLKASGHELYFHEYMYTPEDQDKEKKYEIDFITVKKKKVCPIEVKSSGYTSHKSFDYFIKKYPIKVEDRYIIYTKDLMFKDQITYIPVYMTMFI